MVEAMDLQSDHTKFPAPSAFKQAGIKVFELHRCLHDIFMYTRRQL